MNIPNEIINIIFSYIGIHPISKIMNYYIYDSYYNDFNPYFIKDISNYYCFNYTFKEWYFDIIRHKCNFSIIKNKKYKHTNNPLLIGYYKINDNNNK
jgi:hypothetical protein